MVVEHTLLPQVQPLAGARPLLPKEKAIFAAAIGMRGVSHRVFPAQEGVVCNAKRGREDFGNASYE